MFFPTRQRFTAFVVFAGADHRRFWRIFTKRGWRHCFVIIPIYYPEPGLMAEQYSLIIDQRTNHTAVDVFFQSPKSVADEALQRGATCVIKFEVDRKDYRDYVPRGFLTCVSIVKSVLGIGAWYVITPEHFARWLLRNGGKLQVLKRNDS